MAKIPRGLQDHIRAWAKSLYDDVAEHLAVLNKVRTDHADHRTALLALRTLANELKVDYTADKADYDAGRAEVVKLVTDYAAGRAEIVKLVTDVTALTARVTEAAALVNELKLDLSAHTRRRHCRRRVDLSGLDDHRSGCRRSGGGHGSEPGGSDGGHWRPLLRAPPSRRRMSRPSRRLRPLPTRRRSFRVG